MRTVAIQLRLASMSAERERQQPRVLQTRDVLLDMGVGSHEAVEFDRITVLVGVEPPVAVLEAREQAALDTWMQWLSPDDQPGALWPVGEGDEIGELDHRGSFPVLAFLGDGLVPDLLEPQGVEDCAVYLAIRAAHDTEPDVSVSTGCKRSSWVQPAESARMTTGRLTEEGSSPRRWPTAICAGNWAIAWSNTTMWSETVLAAALPGRRIPDSASPVQSAETQQWMKPEATFEVRSGLLLVLRVDLDEGGVEVQVDRTLALRGGGPTPHFMTHLCEPD